MFSRFFIERPILSNVIAILFVIMGLVALHDMPVEQYPNITPPTVQVTTSYPGASPMVVANTVAAPIEQQVNGVEKMLYMSSTSAADGSYSLTVTFDIGTNTDTAQILVQNRVAVALPQLPQDVQRQGVVTKKQSTSIIMFVVLSSPDRSYDQLFLSNYATINLVDEIARIPGVGDVRTVPPNTYSMRIWLNPDQMRARGISAQNILDALREQNVQVAAGEIGASPAPPGQNFQLTVQTLGRLTDPSQFENIVLKTAPPVPSSGPINVSAAANSSGLATSAGRITRLMDVARVELGGQSYNQFFELDGNEAAGIAVYQLPGANALEVANRVRARMEQLKANFPKGVQYTIPFDTTLFVSQSIHEVYRTLFEAGILVLLVIMVFLQDWRAVLIPATTVPVTIIGAFLAMSGLGFTVNLLTLFGLILAIGIVVDDAIVIVEAAAYNIERGMPSKDAAIQAMTELLGPILGITLVLMAVFIPAAFMAGITGQLYRQFALTIAATALISAINALTLKPTQSAQWLRKAPEHRNIFFRVFNNVYGRVETAYAFFVRWIVRHTVIVLIVFAVLSAGTVWLYLSLPAGFLPVEDQGYAIISLTLPDAASLERTHAVVRKIEDILRKEPGIEHFVANGGNSILTGAPLPNASAIYVIYKDWSERDQQGQSQQAILSHLGREFAKIQEAQVIAFPAPAIRGLGRIGGFELEIEDRGASDTNQLAQVAANVAEAAQSQPDLSSVTSTFQANVPQLYLDIDRVKAKILNVPLTNIFTTLQALLGSIYVNDFNKFGRTYQVRVQGEPQFRDSPEDVKRLYTVNQSGGNVPLGTVLKPEKRVGPQVITRYNLYTTATVNGQSAPGYSTGQALDHIENLTQGVLPPGYDYEWTGVAYQERRVGGQAVVIFGFAVLLVYLVLAAQYESLTSPAAVIFVVPLAILGATVAVALRGFDNNIYTQIGIVLIIALASKNAILIVEVGRELRGAGHGIYESAVEAARRRFRPILMTSFAFILGVLPLVIATGAGAASRQALGTAVFGGMIAATFLAVAFVPAFFVLWESVSERWRSWKSRE